MKSFLPSKNKIISLRDEIARLKQQKPKPTIKPSKLPKDPKAKSPPNGTGPKKKKKTAELRIDKEERIAPEYIPEGSTFKGLHPFTVQGLQILSFNTRYLLEQWQTPEGKIIAGKLPSQVAGHYDHILKSFVFYQYHNCHVTQPLILEQLQEWGVEISVIEDKENNILYKIINNNLTGYPERVVKPNDQAVEIDILKQISKLL